MSLQILTKELDDLVKSPEFGNGSIPPAIYATAWVARIKDVNEKRPAFPKALDFIRDHQLKDGSWGAQHPFSLSDRLLSTLIAIIALKQWESREDSQKIRDGLQFVESNLVQLRSIDKNKLMVGFEVLLPFLIDEVRAMGLNIGEAVEIREQKKYKEEKIEDFLKMEPQNNCVGTNAWLYSVEGLESFYKTTDLEVLPTNSDGLIASNHSVTAYALFKGVHSKDGFNTISKSVELHQGGVQDNVNLEIFDLAWSLNYLYFGGHSMDSPQISAHFNALNDIWIKSKQCVGYSVKGLTSDADDTAVTITVLSEAKVIDRSKALDGLKNFFNGKYFVTYQVEVTPALSTNLNCLIALSYYRDEVPQIINKTLTWAKDHIIKSNYNFVDKWHASIYYTMSRAVTAFLYYDLEFSKDLLYRLIDHQKDDGGWGSALVSSQLESSYVIIAIVFWLKMSNESVDQKVVNCLKKAWIYIKEDQKESEYFWIAKVLFTGVNVDRVTKLCSRIALAKQLDLEKW